MTELLNQTEFNQIPEQPTPEIAPTISTLSGAKPKTKQFLLALAGLIIGLTVVGLIYRSTTSRSLDLTPVPASESPPTPSPTASTETQDLRINSLSIPYAADWLVLFSPIVDSKTPDLIPIYFVRSQQEYLEHAQCASTGSCTSAPLSLSFTYDKTIWTGYSLQDYIRATYPSYPIDKLAVTNLAGHDALVGYTDLARLNYQVLVKTSDTTFQSLALTAREDTREMLTQLIKNLSSLSVIPAQLASPQDITTHNTYTLKLSARLATTEYNILKLILNNLLPPQDATASPSYFLYTEGASTYAPSNYLDYTYYLDTNNPDLVTGQYQLAQLTATLSAPPRDNFPAYLADLDYCETNLDCIYRSSSCVFDSYNRYSLFRGPNICTSLSYAGLGTSQELLEEARCREEIEIQYDSLECVSNQCIVHNPAPVCRE